MKAKVSKVCIIVTAVVLVIVLALNVAVGIMHEQIDKWVVGYKEGGDDALAARAGGALLSEQIQEEGTVLVKNDDNTLPLDKSVDKVNIFGWAASDWVVSGSGSGQVHSPDAHVLTDAFDRYGVQYNKDLMSMYENYRNHREFSENGGGVGGGSANAGALKSFNYEFSRLYEPSIDDKSYYTDQILNDAIDFSDTAIVVIGRVSGESNDSPKVQYKKGAGTTAVKGRPTAANEVDAERTYLEISQEEEELLTYVGQTYKNVIVLINSTNVMELGFLDDIPGLDACLVVATTGSDGVYAIPTLLYGEKTVNDTTVKVSPSGKLADTYAYDLSTSSTYVDTGSGNDTTHFYTNSNGLYPTTVSHTNGSSDEAYAGVAYQDYRESVYVGYKWYETADTMGFWTSQEAKNRWNVNGYDEVVQYPFGYGLSYTTFEWDVAKATLPSGTIKEDDEIKIEVIVTNVGEFPGQDVVELYFTAPYTKGGIEKPSVVLGAFAKTQQILQPGQSEPVTLTMTAGDMASYDYLGKKITGGGYVLENGTYTLTLRTDAHTLAGSKVKGGLDTFTFNVKDDTRVDEEAQNRFTGKDTTDGVAIDGNSDGSANITYLSRENFNTTFPFEASENRAMTDAIMAWNKYSDDKLAIWAKKHADATSPAFGSKTLSSPIYGEITRTRHNEEEDKDEEYTYMGATEYGMQLGLNYDDPGWEDLLDCITKAEMQNLVLHGYTKTQAIASIGKPETLDLDGPNQIGSFSGNKYGTTGYSSIVLAQSWNAQLAYSMGLAFGEDCITKGIRGWYGPGVNIHRSPFGGRNYEYYSEDALLSGIMCANSVSGAKNKGVFAYLKHICLYEGESGRDGMYTWVTEQALREIYLKPFEIAVKKGGSTAIMTSYGRIGAVWTGGSEALLTEVVRGEWGFKGAFLTDYADHQDFMNGDQMLRAGGDLWMDGYQNNGKFTMETSSAAYDQALRSATKNVVYMWLNALATYEDHTNKIESGEITESIAIPSVPEYNFRWYIPVLIVVDVLAIGGCAFWIFSEIRKGKKSEQ